MEEYLFRGKCIISGKWLFGLIAGSIIKHDGRELINLYHKTGAQPAWIDTVGQYTGRKDSAEKMIFAGDLVEFDWWNRGFGIQRKKTGVIVFKNCSFIWEDESRQILIGDTPDYLENLLMRVIGNKFDNPELLK